MKLLTAAAWLLLPTPAIFLIEFDNWRKRRADRRAFSRIVERETASSALRAPYKFNGRAM